MTKDQLMAENQVLRAKLAVLSTKQPVAPATTRSRFAIARAEAMRTGKTVRV